MRKDPTEFRKRFAAWKNGELPYEAGLPKYEDGKEPLANATNYQIPFIQEKAVKLTNAGLATGAVLSTNLLDSIADNALRARLPLKTALGLAVKESTLGNPTDDRSVYKILSPKKAAYFKSLGHGLWINKGDAVLENELINYHREPLYSWPQYYENEDQKWVKQDQSVLKRGFEFYRKNPRMYNWYLKNHPQLVEKRGDEVMNSPEVQEWLSDYSNRKVKMNITKPNPYKITTDWNSIRFPKFKDGKLPKYEDGTPTRVGDYNVYPSAIGASELNITTPEIVVTGKDRRPLYLRYAAERSTYDPNVIRNFTDWLPIVGDIGTGIDIKNAIQNKNYLLAGLLGGMLLFPNVAEKPLKTIGKYFKTFNYFNPTSRLNKNIRTSFANNKTPYAYNIFDPNNFYPFIDGFANTLRGKDIKLTPIDNIKVENRNRHIAWRKYLGLNSTDDLIDSFSGVNFGPYIEHRPGVFSVRPKFSDIKKGFDLSNVHDLLSRNGKFIKDSALGNHGVMSHSVLKTQNEEYPAMLHYWDTWDLLPFQNIKILPKSVREFEVSKMIPGAKPFKYEGYAPMGKREYAEYINYLKNKPGWDKIKAPTYGGDAISAALVGGALITPPAVYGMLEGTKYLIDKADEFAKKHTQNELRNK